MSALMIAPGVIKKTTRLFITGDDVMQIFGCGKSKAYNIIRDVNKCAVERGNRPLPAGKANKYLFAAIYDLPIEEVDKVINDEQEV